MQRSPGHILLIIEKKKEKVLDHASVTEILDAAPDTRSSQNMFYIYIGNRTTQQSFGSNTQNLFTASLVCYSKPVFCLVSKTVLTAFYQLGS